MLVSWNPLRLHQSTLLEDYATISAKFACDIVSFSMQHAGVDNIRLIQPMAVSICWYEVNLLGVGALKPHYVSIRLEWVKSTYMEYRSTTFSYIFMNYQEKE